MARVLILGADSAVGGALAWTMHRAGHTVTGTTRRPERAGPQLLHLDLAAPQRTWPQLDADVAYFCAAISSTAACDADLFTSQRINVEAPAILASRLLARGTHLCLLSCSSVFPGVRPDYKPNDPTAAVTTAGAQKAQLERRLRELSPVRSTVVRFGKVVAPQAALFAGWAQRLGGGERVRTYDDAMIAPVGLNALLDVLARIEATRPAGVYHFTASDEISYARAAAELAKALRIKKGRIETTASAAQDRVPPHEALDASATVEALGVTVPPARAAFDFKAPKK
jgi:dTDP-4-dehydrorhamnose reductase